MKRIALILILLLCVCFFAGCDYEPTVFSDEFEMSVFYAATSKEYWLTITHFNEEKENYFIPKNKEYYPNERKYQKKIGSRIGEIKVLDDFLCYSNQNVKSMLTCTLTGCWLDWESFDERCQTTEDGFVYYVDASNRLFLVGVPDSEEVTIPEFIDGYKVIQLGKHIGFFTSETKEVDGSIRCIKEDLSR